MKKIIFLLLINLPFTSSQFVSAQDYCQSKVNENNSLILEQIINVNIPKSYSGNRPMVRLALHNINKSNGTGGYNWSNIRFIVDDLDRYFNEHDICFTVVLENDINDDNYFNIKKYQDNSYWSSLITEDHVFNAINIYFVKNAGSGGIATGFLFDINSYPTVTLSDKSGFNTTFKSAVLAHELGHCLGLYHTHHTNTCLEEVPRTNCTSCGDMLCDTPADPFLALSTNNVDDATCEYIGGEKLNGVPYKPDTKNIMSYSLTYCLKYFSEGQGERMRNFILNTNLFDSYIVPSDLLLTGIKNGDSYYGTQSSINSSATHIDGNVLYEAENEIVMSDGFEVTASYNSSFVAQIGSYLCNEPLIVNNGKHMIIENNINNLIYKIKLFPNPTRNTTTVLLEGPGSKEARISVFDLSGKEMQVRIEANENRYNLDVSHLSKGLYFVKVSTFGEAQTKQLVIQ